MAADNWAATATSAAIVDADDNREYLTLQLLSGDITALAIGEAAVYGSGVHLLAAGDSVTVRGWIAREAVYAICDTGDSSTGSSQDGDMLLNI